MNKDLKYGKDWKMYYSGQILCLPEILALIVKRMIENDIPNSRYFSDGQDPYKWLAETLNKKVTTVRGWTYDWRSSSGARITLEDFFNLIYITKSQRSSEFIKNIISDASPEELQKNHSDMIKQISAALKDLTATLDRMVE